MNDRLFRAIGDLLPKDRPVTCKEKLRILRPYCSPRDPDAADKAEIKREEKRWNEACREQRNLDEFHGSFKWEVPDENGVLRLRDVSMPIGSMDDRQYASMSDGRVKGTNSDIAVIRELNQHRNSTRGQGWFEFCKVRPDFDC